MINKILNARSVYQDQNEGAPSHFLEMRNLLIQEPRIHSNKARITPEGRQDVKYLRVPHTKHITLNTTACNDIQVEPANQYKRSLSSYFQERQYRPPRSRGLAPLSVTQPQPPEFEQLPPKDNPAYDYLRSRRPLLTIKNDPVDLRLISSKYPFQKIDKTTLPPPSQRQYKLRRRPQQINLLLQYVSQNEYIQGELAMRKISHEQVERIVSQQRQSISVILELLVLEFKIKSIALPSQEEKLIGAKRLVDDRIVEHIVREVDTQESEYQHEGNLIKITLEAKRLMFQRIMEYQSLVKSEYDSLVMV